MIQSLLAVAALAVVATGSARAQSSPNDTSAARGGAGIRGNNITSTGETVPNPGASQGAGVTPMDRGIYQDDNKISNGICKGC